MIDTPSPATVTVTVDESFTLSCTSRGSPPDTFTWRRGSGQEESSTNIVTVSSTNAVFTANYVDTITTSGVYMYTCTVSNPMGTNSETITVNVGKYCFVSVKMYSIPLKPYIKGIYWEYMVFRSQCR